MRAQLPAPTERPLSIREAFAIIRPDIPKDLEGLSLLHFIKDQVGYPLSQCLTDTNPLIRRLVVAARCLQCQRERYGLALRRMHEVTRHQQCDRVYYKFVLTALQANAKLGRLRRSFLRGMIEANREACFRAVLTSWRLNKDFLSSQSRISRTTPIGASPLDTAITEYHELRLYYLFLTRTLGKVRERPLRVAKRVVQLAREGIVEAMRTQTCPLNQRAIASTSPLNSHSSRFERLVVGTSKYRSSPPEPIITTSSQPTITYFTIYLKLHQINDIRAYPRLPMTYAVQYQRNVNRLRRRLRSLPRFITRDIGSYDPHELQRRAFLALQLALHRLMLFMGFARLYGQIPLQRRILHRLQREIRLQRQHDELQVRSFHQHLLLLHAFKCWRSSNENISEADRKRADQLFLFIFGRRYIKAWRAVILQRGARVRGVAELVARLQRAFYLRPAFENMRSILESSASTARREELLTRVLTAAVDRWSSRLQVEAELYSPTAILQAWTSLLPSRAFLKTRGFTDEAHRPGQTRPALHFAGWSSSESEEISSEMSSGHLRFAPGTRVEDGNAHGHVDIDKTLHFGDEDEGEEEEEACGSSDDALLGPSELRQQYRRVVPKLLALSEKTGAPLPVDRIEVLSHENLNALKEDVHTLQGKGDRQEVGRTFFRENTETMTVAMKDKKRDLALTRKSLQLLRQEYLLARLAREFYRGFVGRRVLYTAFDAWATRAEMLATREDWLAGRYLRLLAGKTLHALKEEWQVQVGWREQKRAQDKAETLRLLALIHTADGGMSDDDYEEADIDDVSSLSTEHRTQALQRLADEHYLARLHGWVRGSGPLVSRERLHRHAITRAEFLVPDPVTVRLPETLDAFLATTALCALAREARVRRTLGAEFARPKKHVPSDTSRLVPGNRSP